MAKKEKVYVTNGHYSIVKLCAFWGVILAGVAGLINFIVVLLEKMHVDVSWWGSKISGACNVISQIALLVSAWIAAYDYVKNKSKAWKIVFLVFFILTLLGFVGINISAWF